MEELLNLANARHEDQRALMERIATEGFCPFCPENLERAELEPVLKETPHWHVRNNRWPFENARVHLLGIHRTHITCLADITPEAWLELGEITRWVENNYNLQHGGLNMRFGNVDSNGATVAHLHFQIASADITDRNNPQYQQVRFRVG